MQVGELIGNDYVVSQRAQGRRSTLIVSGIQKIGDGAPVRASSTQQPCSSTHSSAGRSSRRSARWSSFSAGAVAIPTMPVAQYPTLAPPQVNVTAIYTGANAQEVETAVTTPLEQAINGVEGMLYMTSSSTNSGVSTITRDVRRHARSGRGRGGRAEPRQPGARPHADRSPDDRHHRAEAGDRLHHGRRRLLPRRRSTTRSSSATTSTSTSRTRSSAYPASATSSIFGERKYSMRAVARSRPARRTRADRQRRRQGTARAERPGGGGQPRTGAGAVRARCIR